MRLKRKLKPQYINKKQKENNIKNNISIENKIINGCISFLWIILLLFWSGIPSITLHFLGIDSNTLSSTIKIFISFINDILFILLIIGVYFKTVKKDFYEYFNHNLGKNLKKTLFYWSLGLSTMVLGNYIIMYALNGQLAENEQTVRTMFEMYPFYMAFNIIIYAPITEELIFRKSIKNIFNSKWTYILTSGLIFGGLHVVSSITNLASLLHLLPYCSLGIAFAWLYYDSDNIFSTITAHFIHNTIALILYIITL